MANANVIPERVLLTLVRAGVAAISADLTTAAVDESILDKILQTLDADERLKARTYWQTNPPAVVLGFPRTETAFPCFALTLASDEPSQDYIGQGEIALLDDDDLVVGNEFKKRIVGTFSWWVYNQQPDLLAWWYRVLRRILNAGTRYMIARGLTEPQLSGADLMPEHLAPDNIFARRVTITVEYEEDWDDQDGLWQALNGDPEAYIRSTDQLFVHHRDQVDIPGGVTPIEEE